MMVSHAVRVRIDEADDDARFSLALFTFNDRMVPKLQVQNQSRNGCSPRAAL